MPKLRNGNDDATMLTQWFGRKCRNHNPLAELSMVSGERSKQASTYKSQEAKELHVLADDPSILLYGSAGRLFSRLLRGRERERATNAGPLLFILERNSQERALQRKMSCECEWE